MASGSRLRLPPFPITITSLSVAAALLGDAMLYVVMPSRPELWHISIFQVGILLSVNRLVRLFTNPARSYIVARFGVGGASRICFLLKFYSLGVSPFGLGSLLVHSQVSVTMDSFRPKQ